MLAKCEFNLVKLDQTPKQISLKILLIDCQSICLHGTMNLLSSAYAGAEILAIKTADHAVNHIYEFQPDLVIMDILLPENSHTIPQVNTGKQLLKTLMYKYPRLNIFVQSTHIKTLIQIKNEIKNHQGGFIVGNKNLSPQEILTRVNLALQGVTHIKDIKGTYWESKIKPECLKVLYLAFKEGLQDKTIAQHICVSERMVRHYWDELQQSLNIDCSELKNQGKNIRAMTHIRAREEGLID